jgi:Tfp pilus assembly protein PilN
MRTNLNLSSRPFTNHRLFWIAITFTVFVSLWFFLWVSAQLTEVSAKADAVKVRIESQKALADAAKAEREKKEREQRQVLITDQEALELASARILILQKSFSWDRMIGALEQLVPHQARIAAIKVDGISDAAGSSARVQVKALGATNVQMTEMMTNIENSGGLFVTGQADQDSTTDNGETPFTLELTYNPTRGNAR